MKVPVVSDGAGQRAGFAFCWVGGVDYRNLVAPVTGVCHLEPGFGTAGLTLEAQTKTGFSERKYP